MTLKWRVAKFETDRENNFLEKHLGSINKICTMVDAFYAMDQKTAEKNDWTEMKKERKTETRKDQIWKFQNLKSRWKNGDTLALPSN